MRSDPKLRRWYLHFNRKYHNGTLPLDTRIIWEPSGAGSQSAEVERSEDGTFTIRINPALMGLTNEAKMAMHHEMAHIASNLFHGRKFNEMMLELAVKGAFKGIW